jgi:hypothetical protein
MESIKTATELKDAIMRLEERQAIQSHLLKEEFSLTIEKLKPANLLRSFTHNIGFAGVFKTLLTGIATVYLSKKFITRSSGGQIKKLAGKLIQLGVTGIVAKNRYLIKSWAEKFLKQIVKKRQVPDTQYI